MQVTIVNGKTVEISDEQVVAVREGVRVIDGTTFLALPGLKATLATVGLLALFSGDVAGATALGRLEDVIDSLVAIRSQI